MHVANNIYKDMAVMTKDQSETVELIHFDLETTETKVK